MRNLAERDSFKHELGCASFARGAAGCDGTFDVMDAVVPAAGLGTRMLPLTRVVPKELLPLDGRPIVQHVVDELLGAGVDRIWLVTRPGKRAIEEQFDGHSRVGIVRQSEPRGLGDAVLC